MARLTDRQKEVLLQASRGEVQWTQHTGGRYGHWTDRRNVDVSRTVLSLISAGLIHGIDVSVHAGGPCHLPARLTEAGWETRV